MLLQTWIRSLKQRLAPRDQARKPEICNQYKMLNKNHYNKMLKPGYKVGKQSINGQRILIYLILMINNACLVFCKLFNSENSEKITQGVDRRPDSKSGFRIAIRFFLVKLLTFLVTLYSEFNKLCMISLQSKMSESEDIPTVYQLIEYFRDHRRLITAQKGNHLHSAFPATFQEKATNGETMFLQKIPFI